MILELNTNLIIGNNYKIISLDKIAELISLGTSKFDNDTVQQSLNFKLQNGSYVNISNINDLENV